MSEVISLDKLLPGMSGIIVFLNATGTIRQRLLEMGFVKGSIITVDKLAPLGDPMELILKGYHLSLRKDEGACILVRSFIDEENSRRG